MPHGISTAQASIYLEFVHRLNDLGAVVTHAAHATSQEGPDVEWHEISLLTVNGGVVDRCEIFDEADLDAALPVSRNCERSHRGWETRQAEHPSAS